MKTSGISKGSFIRISDGDRRLTTYEVQLLLSSRGQPREDEEPVPTATLQDLDSTMVEALVARLRQTRPFAFRSLDTTAVLLRAKILVPHDGSLVASLGRLLALVSRGLIGQTGTRRWARSQLSGRTGLSDKAVRNWLAVLRKEGVVEVVGNPRSRNVRYRIRNQDPLFPDTKP